MVERNERPGIVWFRRDLRLDDNEALAAACSAHREIIPLFVVDDTLWSAAGPNRRWFLAGALADLDRQLRGRLAVRRGVPASVIAELAGRHDVGAVYRAQDVGVYGRQRDADVDDALADSEVDVIEVGSPWAVAPGTVRTGAGHGYQVFTAFHRSWLDHLTPAEVARPDPIRVVADVRSDDAPTPPDVAADLPTPTVAGAYARLDDFLAGPVDDYDERRNLPAVDGTSQLSPYLHFGLLHPNQILRRLDRRHTGQDTFAKELAWRDFYADVLHHRPETAWESWNPSMAGMQIDEGASADERFERWCEGRTGYPIVDAGMRQLVACGWMHNRVRMITASFLVKDLHLDWSRGARFFLQHLVDGDLSSNNHGWQWVAGTGTDAAPYFRIFNPTVQGERFDPEGAYVRRWVRELAGIAGKAVHRATDVDGYPSSVVDHATERAEALRRYAAR